MNGNKDIPVLFENNYCLAVNKPQGLAVQGGAGIKSSLDSILSQMYKERPLLIHRLDKDTSGVMLAAKTREAAAGLSALFREGKQNRPEGSLGKSYLALVSGIPNPRRGAIKTSLDIRGRRLHAETAYNLIDSGSAGGKSCSLLELELITGRMHQIRRHLLSIGHPILGDDKYGDFLLNKELRKAIKLKKLLLHSYRIRVPRFPPFFPDAVTIEAPLPEHFTNAMLVLF